MYLRHSGTESHNLLGYEQLHHLLKNNRCQAQRVLSWHVREKMMPRNPTVRPIGANCRYFAKLASGGIFFGPNNNSPNCGINVAIWGIKLTLSMAVDDVKLQAEDISIKTGHQLTSSLRLFLSRQKKCHTCFRDRLLHTCTRHELEGKCRKVMPKLKSSMSARTSGLSRQDFPLRYRERIGDGAPVLS